MSAEIGAVPQSDNDPAADFPSLETCKQVLLSHTIGFLFDAYFISQEGMEPTECSQECLFGCKSPICSMNCLCACTSPAEKSDLIAILKQEQKELKLLSVQSDMWKAGEKGLASDGLMSGRSVHSIRTFNAQPGIQYAASIQSSSAQPQMIHEAPTQAQVGLYDSRRAPYQSAVLDHQDIQGDTDAPSVRGRRSVDEVGQVKMSANPRFQRHQQISRKRKYMKALAYNAFMKQATLKAQEATQEANDQATTDVGGFDWDKMSQKVIQKQDPAMTALGRESDKIDDVYDPTEDPQNIGPGDDNKKDKKPVEWWSEDTLKGAKLNDQWWQHGGEDGMTG